MKKGNAQKGNVSAVVIAASRVHVLMVAKNIRKEETTYVPNSFGTGERYVCQMMLESKLLVVPLTSMLGVAMCDS